MANKKVIEAEARISASDKTGDVFATVAKKVQRLGEASQKVNGRVSATVARMGKVMDAAVPIAAAATAHKARDLARHVVETYREFDDVRRYQKAVMGLSDEAQKPFLEQARRLGTNSQFSANQVLEAQLDLAQRGVKQEFIVPMIEQAKNYAAAMNVSLPDAAKTLEAIIFSTGKHIESAGEAFAVMEKTVNMSVKLAKIGGLDNEDIKGAFKFGALSGSKAGLSDELMGSAFALMRRSGIEGSEAGVAVRAMASKLMSPTRSGLMALNAMGIDYNKFQKMPGGLSVDNFGKSVQTELGTTISAKNRKRLEDVFNNSEIVADRNQFTAAVTDILKDQFVNKKGKVDAASAKKIAKVAGAFHKLSAENIDAMGLLMAIAEANPNMAQLNALFTSQQAGRISTVVRNIDLLKEYLHKLMDVPNDFAKGIGEERMGGFAGAVKRFEMSVNTLYARIGESNDSVLTRGATAMADWVGALGRANDETIKYATNIGAAVVAVAGFEAALKAMSIMSVLSGGSALNPGGGVMGRFGMLARYGLYGAAGYAGWKVGQGAMDVVTGKGVHGDTAESIVGMREELKALNARLAEMRSKSKDETSLAMLSQPLLDQIGLLQMRIATFEKKAREQQDIDRGDSIKSRIKDYVERSEIKVPPVELKGQAQVSVKVQVDGPGKVTGLGSTSSGNIRANAGVTMPDAGRPRQ